jgi:hypothetical protein
MWMEVAVVYPGICLGVKGKKWGKDIPITGGGGS